MANLLDIAKWVVLILAIAAMVAAAAAIVGWAAGGAGSLAELRWLTYDGDVSNSAVIYPLWAAGKAIAAVNAGTAYGGGSPWVTGLVTITGALVVFLLALRAFQWAKSVFG